MATHSSILAWEIPWPEEPGGLYSPWSRRESDMTEQHTHTHFSSNKKLNSNSQLVKTKKQTNPPSISVSLQIQQIAHSDHLALGSFPFFKKESKLAED